MPASYPLHTTKTIFSRIKNFKDIIFSRSTNKKSIEAWLELHGVQNYNLVHDDHHKWVVNVEGDVNLDNKNLSSIDVQFGVVSGYFSCGHNLLTSLKGSPHTVLGSFSCYHNQLSSLEFFPTQVDRFVDCSHNLLTSLAGCPALIHGTFNCSFNSLSTLMFAPEQVKGGFFCNNNHLTSLEHAPSVVYKDFSCTHNQLENLDFLPSHVGFCFFCDHNPKLGSFQHTNDFDSIKEKYTQEQNIKIEAALLQEALSHCEKKLINPSSKKIQKI